jgi:hypothetical protein
MGVRLSTYDSTWPFLVKPGPSSVWVLEAQVLASEHHVPTAGAQPSRRPGVCRRVARHGLDADALGLVRSLAALRRYEVIADVNLLGRPTGSASWSGPDGARGTPDSCKASRCS